MDTESNQSNEDRYQDASQEDERQRTGLFSWEEPHNLMPPWSVPPGLLVPGPRQPDADATPSRSAHAIAAPEPSEPGSVPEPPADPEGGEPAATDNSWPGVALPAGWFLRAQPRPPAVRAESG